MAKTENRKARRAALFAQSEPTAKAPRSSPKVLQMLKGNTNPLVAITLMYPNFEQLGFNISRSMGFILERFSSRHRLIVTCRHAFQDLNKTGCRLVIAFKAPKPIMLACVGNPILDTEAESDIAFLIVRDPSDSPVKPFDLTQGDLPVQEGMALWNTKNQCDPLSGIYDVQVDRQQPSAELDEISFYKFSQPTIHCINKKDIKRQTELLGEGWTRCRLLQMVSRPGYSGSPIWDDDLRLYGMNMRGSMPEDNAGMGDTAVCLPTSALLMARHRVEPQIQARLIQITK